MFKIILILIQAIFAQESAWIEQPETDRLDLISVGSENTPRYHLCSECRRRYSDALSNGNIQPSVPHQVQYSNTPHNNTVQSNHSIPIVDQLNADNLYSGSIFAQPLSNLVEYRPVERETMNNTNPSLAGSIFDQPPSNLVEYNPTPNSDPVDMNSNSNQGAVRQERSTDSSKKSDKKEECKEKSTVRKKTTRNSTANILDFRIVLAVVIAISLIN